MSQLINFRPSNLDDSDQLVLLVDMASRGLASFLWEQAAAPGRSAFEFGREMIRNQPNEFVHYTNWRVAEHDGRLVGALNGYVLADSTSRASSGVEQARPLAELKQMALGTWYLSAAAILPECQGQGFGKGLLLEAEELARAAGKNRLSLVVGSFNVIAHGLYTKTGFHELSRRPFASFRGSDRSGEWILMAKHVG